MYQELAPDRALSGIVTCDWERTAGTGGEILVLPDGCVDIVWRSDGALFIAGPDLGPVVHDHPAGVRFVGLRLEPGAAATVLGVAVDELRDERVTLSALWGAAGESLADRLASSPTDDVRRQLLAHAIGARVDRVERDEHVLVAARALSAGAVRVTDVADQIGLSDRQLQRRFVIQVGYGPKTFHRVMRFRRFLNGDREHGLAAMALAAGYADQAHLTRECRRLSDRTPAELLAVA